MSLSVLCSVVPGGKAPVRNADQDSQEVADSVRGDVETKVGKKYDQFQVACYRTQVVAGINYYIKVRIVTHSDPVRLALILRNQSARISYCQIYL